MSRISRVNVSTVLFLKMNSEALFLKLKEWGKERGFWCNNPNELSTEVPSTHPDISPIVSKPVHLASAEGNEDILNILFKNYNAKSNSETVDGWTPLHCNAALSKPNIGEILLQHHANIEAQTKDKETPLYKAVIYNNEEMVEFLLKNKANPNVKIIQSTTPLHASAGASDNITRLLLEYGANVDCVDEFGQTPLHVCTSSRKKIELVLKNSKHPKKLLETMDMNNNKTPLHTSIIANDEIEGTKALLKHGANIEARATFDLTPLHIATEYHKAQTVKCLLEAGANIEAKDQAQETSIFRAIMNNNPIILKLLLENNANTEVVNIHGDTPLTKGAQNCHRLEIDPLIFDILVNDGGSDINQGLTSSCGATSCGVLHCFTAYGKSEIVDILINAKHQKLDVNLPDKNGDTALHLTATYDAKNVSQMIQNHMNQTNIPPPSSPPRLSDISEGMSEYGKIASMLLNHGANINAINNAGLNPLNLALGLLKKLPK